MLRARPGRLPNPVSCALSASPAGHPISLYLARDRRRGARGGQSRPPLSLMECAVGKVGPRTVGVQDVRATKVAVGRRRRACCGTVGCRGCDAERLAEDRAIELVSLLVALGHRDFHGLRASVGEADFTGTVRVRASRHAAQLVVCVGGIPVTVFVNHAGQVVGKLRIAASGDHCSGRVAAKLVGFLVEVVPPDACTGVSYDRGGQPALGVELVERDGLAILTDRCDDRCGQRAAAPQRNLQRCVVELQCAAARGCRRNERAQRAACTGRKAGDLAILECQFSSRTDLESFHPPGVIEPADVATFPNQSPAPLRWRDSIRLAIQNRTGLVP